MTSIDTAIIRNTANTFNTNLTEINNALSAMSSASGAIEDAYRGTAANAYTGKINEIINNLRSVSTRIQSEATALTNAANSADELEQQHTTLANSLETGTRLV